MRYSKKYLPYSFYIEVGNNKKASYQTKYSFSAQEANARAKAYFWYQGINCGYGYKKRLIFVNESRVVTILEQYQSV